MLCFIGERGSFGCFFLLPEGSRWGLSGGALHFVVSKVGGSKRLGLTNKGCMEYNRKEIRIILNLILIRGGYRFVQVRRENIRDCLAVP